MTNRRSRRRAQASKALRVHGARGIARTEQGQLVDWHAACAVLDTLYPDLTTDREGTA